VKLLLKVISFVVIYTTQDGFIHIAASGWISVNTEEKKNKQIYFQMKTNTVDKIEQTNVYSELRRTIIIYKRKQI